MRLRIRRSSCLSRNNFSRRPCGACGMDRGYALLVLMMMATILLVSLTVALPSVYLEGQREREEELIFRGNEYARAIAIFHRQFQLSRVHPCVEQLHALRRLGIPRHRGQCRHGPAGPSLSAGSRPAGNSRSPKYATPYASSPHRSADDASLVKMQIFKARNWVLEEWMFAPLSFRFEVWQLRVWARHRKR